MSVKADLPSGKEERIKHLKTLYENSDPNKPETQLIIDLAKETGISQRTLFSYKTKYEWKRVKVESPNVRKETNQPRNALPGLTDIEKKAKTFLSRSRMDLDWQAEPLPKNEHYSEETKILYIKRIGKEYFLTGMAPLTICENRGLDFSDFVEWTSENTTCRNIWESFSKQRTAFVSDFMQSYCFELIKKQVMGELPPLETVYYKWKENQNIQGGGEWIPTSKSVTPAPRPTSAQIIDIMTKVSDWAEKAKNKATTELGTDAKALKSLQEIQDEIDKVTFKLRELNDEGRDQGITNQ